MNRLSVRQFRIHRYLPYIRDKAFLNSASKDSALGVINLRTLEESTSLQILLVVVGGLMIGSFLNVVISRVPAFAANQYRLIGIKGPVFDLLTPTRSICPACEKVIPWRHNIPVFSWIFLRGQAACCDARIPVRYLVVECMGLAIVLTAWSIHGATWPAIAYSTFCLLLLAIAVVDIETRTIPLVLTIPLGASGLLVAILGMEYGASINIENAVYGMFLGGFGTWALRYVQLRITHRLNLGGGDLYLAATLGAWLGWQVIPFALTIAYASLMVYRIGYLARHGAKRDTSIAFAPFLVFGGILVYLHGTLS